MNILIVDDSKAMRSIVARALKEMGVPGYPYEQAANGKAALESIAEEPPSLVISDFNMPEMTGMELLRTMRSNGIGIPFGFVTSESSSELRAEAAAAGASFLLGKPFTPANVSKTMGPVLAGLGCSTEMLDGSAAPELLPWQGKLPMPVQIRATLNSLIRRNIQVTSRPAAPIPAASRILAEYNHAEGEPVFACCICDLAFALRSGAALTLIPAGVAEEAIKKAIVQDPLAENFHEVLNVMASFFSLGGSTHAHLGAVHFPGEQVDPKLSAQLDKPAARLDLAIDLAGYGAGLLTLVLIASQ